MKTNTNGRLGSVRQLIDTDASVVRLYAYGPFGQTIEESSNGPQAPSNDFMFTGQWFDPEIGQYYLRARQYDPQLMRFSSRDSFEGLFEEPMSLYRYLYCRNDPINKIDPSCLITVHVTWTGMFSAGLSGVGQLGFAVDDNGNISIISIGGIGSGSPAGFGGVSFGATSADTIYNLQGWGGSAGGTAGPLWMPGVDYLWGLDRSNPYWGMELNFGHTWTPTTRFGLNLEAHAQITYTNLLASGNPYEFLQEMMGVDLSEIKEMKRRATDLCDFLDFIGQGDMVPLPPQYLGQIMGYFAEN